MTSIDERSSALWERALLTALDDSIADLREVIFVDGWESIRAESESDEAALRASMRYYERGLADLLAILRIAGFFENGLAWSQFKADRRGTARDTNEEISLRTALDEAFYMAEATSPGSPTEYGCWLAELVRFLASRATPSVNSQTSTETERIEWALSQLADLEDHQRFHTEFRSYALNRATIPEDERRKVLELEDRLFELMRFDLILNASLRWLAGVDPDLLVGLNS